MSQHPGLWLTQIRLNPGQSLFSTRELVSVPDIHSIAPDLGPDDDPTVWMHLFAGCYSFWGGAVDFETGEFLGYVRDRSIASTGRWGLIPYSYLVGIRVPIKIEGVMTRIPLEREERFHPQALSEALRWT